MFVVYPRDVPRSYKSLREKNFNYCTVGIFSFGLAASGLREKKFHHCAVSTFGPATKPI